MLYRIVHQQTEPGGILIDDIESGLPNEEFGIYFKQHVYVPYNRQYFQNNQVIVDANQPGYVDLPLSDKVELSRDRGTIKGLEDAGLVNVISIGDGALSAPSIDSARFDGDGSTTDAFEVEFQIVDTTSDTGDFEITLGIQGGSPTTFTATDSTSGSDDSNALASSLATAINNDASASFDASVSTDTITVTSASPRLSFTHSTNVTDASGSINTNVIATGRVVLSGSNFESTSPDVSSVVVRDDSAGQTVELTETDITSGGGINTFDDDVIIITESVHGLGTSSGDVESVDITADGQTDTSATVEV